MFSCICIVTSLVLSSVLALAAFPPALGLTICAINAVTIGFTVAGAIEDIVNYEE